VKIPEGMVVVIDTREQNPFFKRPPKGLTIVRDTLKVGDYSLRGFEDEIAVERKDIHDFLKSISHDRKRFKSMLSSMSEYFRKFIVIEGGLSEVLSPVEIKKGIGTGDSVRPLSKKYVNMNPEAVFQTIVSIMVRYGVAFFFAEDRRQAEKLTLSVLTKFYLLKRSHEL